MIETINIENGPTLYLYLDKRRHTTFFEFVTNFGGRTKNFISNGEEYHIQDGVAHILEHYVVENNNVGNFLKLLGERQMGTNASTDNNTTRYYFSAVEDIIYGIETMLKGIYSVEFTEEKLERLKNPILQEIRGRMNNKFYHSTIMETGNLFHSSFRSVGGTLEEVKNTTVEDIEVCYKTFYQPSNQMIFIGGNFNKDEVIDCIKKFYKELNFKEIKYELIKDKEIDEVVKKEDVLEFPTPRDYVNISFKINMSKYSIREKLDYDFYLVFFYQMIFGITSKIYKKLVDKKIITGGISKGHTIFGDYVIVGIGASTDKKNEFIKEVLDTINNLDGFNEEVFELEKKNMIMDIILRGESIMRTLLPFIDNIIYYNYPYIDKVSDIERMNYKDVVNAIKNLDFSNYTITTITEKK